MADAQVSVLLAGRHVRGSPLMVDVCAGPLWPHSCQLLGMPDLPSSGDMPPHALASSGATALHMMPERSVQTGLQTTTAPLQVIAQATATAQRCNARSALCLCKVQVAVCKLDAESGFA